VGGEVFKMAGVGSGSKHLTGLRSRLGSAKDSSENGHKGQGKIEFELLEMMRRVF
jgi:hypothetical protein